MLVIPAIDIRGGRVVRLFQGDPGRETFYGDDPVEVAKRWKEAGAERIHLVDLDGAFMSAHQETGLPSKIADAVSPVIIQVGGGFRTFEDVRALLDHDERLLIILGTAAILSIVDREKTEKTFLANGGTSLEKEAPEPDFLKKAVNKYSHRVIVALDAFQEDVVVCGWRIQLPQKAKTVAREILQSGVRTIIYTDKERDGTLSGPNIAAIEEMLSVEDISLIASGGISSEEDIRKLKELEDRGLGGIILGKALYDGRIDLRRAIEIAAQTL